MRRKRLPRIKQRGEPKQRPLLNYIIGVLVALVVVATGLLFYVNRRYPATAEPTMSSTPTRTAPATQTPAAVRPTRTPPPSPVRQMTPTPLSSPTPIPTPSPTPPPTRPPITATPGPPRPSATPTPLPFPYTVEGPFYRPNNIANYAGCKWLGLAGEVFGPNGKPQTGLIIHVWGGGVDELVYSGGAPAYGSSGWERSLDDHPKEGIFFVQLHDGTRPLSPVVEVRTRDDCFGNLVIINFHQQP